MRPTLYEFAGGEQAFPPFADALHARCLADPELNHPFSHPGQHPEHNQRLAAYLGEAFGGPARYSAECADQSHVVCLHAGNGDPDAQMANGLRGTIKRDGMLARVPHAFLTLHVGVGTFRPGFRSDRTGPSGSAAPSRSPPRTRCPACGHVRTPPCR